MTIRTLFAVAAAFAIVCAAPASAETDKEKFLAAYKKFQTLSQSGGSRTELYEVSEEAAKYGRIILKPTGKAFAQVLLNQGSMQLEFGKPEALDTLTEALTVFEKAYPGDQTMLIDPLLRLGAAQRVSGKTEKGSASLDRAIAISEGVLPADSVQLAQIYLEAAQAKVNGVPDPNAILLFDKSLDIFEDQDAQYEPYVSLGRFQRGKMYLGMQKYSASAKDLEVALDLIDKHASMSHLKLSAHMMLVNAYESDGKRGKSTRHCQVIGQATEQAGGADLKPIYTTDAEYPRKAMKDGAKGYVVLSMTVDDEGYAKDLEVSEIEGPATFSRAAMIAARKLRYAPRFANGKPVSTTGVKYRFDFDPNG